MSTTDHTTTSSSTMLHGGDIPGTCPTPVEMGNSGWNILHGAAAVYPYAPSEAQQDAMRQFIHGFSYAYPCNWCAYHMRLYLQQHPPDVSNKLTVTRFFCELHNNVNEHLGKPQYACDAATLLRRWHPGYPDKMADKPSMEERVAAEQRRLAAEQAAAAAASAGDATTSTHTQPHAAMQWRSGGAAEAATAVIDANNNNSSGSHAQTRTAPGQRSWWSSLWSPADDKDKVMHSMGNSSNSSSAAAATRPATAAAAATTAPAAAGKVSDGETNIAMVLQRLKGCMVYCPEDEQQGKK